MSALPHDASEPVTDEPVAPRLLNPSPYLLPQQCSPDRRRVRRAIVGEARRSIRFAPFPPDELEARGYARLPPHVEELPPELDFPVARKAMFLASKLKMQANAKLAGLTGVRRGPGPRGYRRLYLLMKGPETVMQRWQDDAEFTRQRLTGVNPMALRGCGELPAGELGERAEASLRAFVTTRSRLVAVPTLREAFAEGRLFETDYRLLLDAPIQAQAAAKGRVLAGPRCLFWRNELDRLEVLAIRVDRRAGQDGPVFTPHDADRVRWLAARAHAQAADACVHEGFYHLLETHLVSEAVAIATYRNLYPEHPVRQLLEPHYAYNLAIDTIARADLLAPGGPIDSCMAAGVTGTLLAARRLYQGWDLMGRSFHRDVAERGLRSLPESLYVQDGERVYDAVARFVRGVLQPWYRTPADVILDTELQAWAAEAASSGGGAVPGFPAALTTPEALFELLVELIFRAGPQHAAVNNGQYDAYGYIPNTPGSFDLDLDGSDPIEETAWYAALPDRDRSLSQLGMVNVLSTPTVRSLAHAGDAGAFAPEVSFAASEAVAAFRRRLYALSDEIAVRNAGLAVPYRYLDPRNISRSTDI